MKVPKFSSREREREREKELINYLSAKLREGNIYL